MLKKIYALLGVFAVSGFAFSAYAADGKIDTGDTAFVFLAAVMVFIMLPGLALFYGGLARRKNSLNMMMMTLVLMSVVVVQWVLFGFSLSFGPDHAHLLGGFDWSLFRGVGFAANADYAGTIPFSLFAMYQMMFAVISPALISGAVEGRMKFSAYIVFALLWTSLVYDPLAHWVWGNGGWLKNLGVLDFAGGIVIHISSGVAALVAVLVLGKRNGYGQRNFLPHNLPITLLGAGLLWFGWFGFNSGGALAADGVAMNAFIATDVSAACGLLSWMAIEWLHNGKPTMVGSVTGAVVGLAAITPAAGYVGIVSAMIIGFVVSPLCYLFIMVVKKKFGYDDALDAFGCHGIGCIWGTLATGLFSSTAVNPAGADGLFFGNPAQLGIQAVGVAAAVVFSGTLSFLILKVISVFTKIRVNQAQEEEGADTALHGEMAYPSMTGS